MKPLQNIKFCLLLLYTKQSSVLVLIKLLRIFLCATKENEGFFSRKLQMTSILNLQKNITWTSSSTATSRLQEQSSNLESLHQRSRSQQCPGHQWSTVWAAWYPTVGWCEQPSRGTSSHRPPLPEHPLNCSPKTKNGAKEKQCPKQIVSDTCQRFPITSWLLPAAQFDPWSRIHSQPWLGGSRGLWAGLLSSDP